MLVSFRLRNRITQLIFGNGCANALLAIFRELSVLFALSQPADIPIMAHQWWCRGQKWCLAQD
jgi:hypothetical protein